MCCRGLAEMQPCWGILNNDRAGLTLQDKEGAWVGRAHWHHHVAPQVIQNGLRVEDELGDAQARLWSRGAGGPGEKQQCVLGVTLLGTGLLSGYWLKRSRSPGWALAWGTGQGTFGVEGSAKVCGATNAPEGPELGTPSLAQPVGIEGTPALPWGQPEG